MLWGGGVGKLKYLIIKKKIPLFVLENGTFVKPLRDNLLYSDRIWIVKESVMSQFKFIFPGSVFVL